MVVESEKGFVAKKGMPTRKEDDFNENLRNK